MCVGPRRRKAATHDPFCIWSLSSSSSSSQHTKRGRGQLWPKRLWRDHHSKGGREEEEEDSAPPRPFSAVATVAHAAAVRSMKSSNLCIHGGRGRDKAGGGEAPPVPAIIAALRWAATSRGGDIRSAWRRRYGIRRRDRE